MGELPTVACICLYANRPQFVPQMLESFRCQTYPNKYLWIYDTDAFDWPFGQLRDNERVIHRNPEPIGKMRNEVAAMVGAELIAHHDSDDYYAPRRLEDQVARLLESGKAVTGYNSARFYRESDGAWYYVLGTPQGSLGATLMYRREYWEKRNRFPNRMADEDRAFVDIAHCHGQLISTDAKEMFFASIHPGNTSPRQASGSNWKPLPDCRHLYPEAF